MEQADWKAHWGLDPDITFLNHGSFGATPKAILNVQQELQRELEQNPVDFFQRKFSNRLEQARQALAEFVRTDPEGTVIVPNTTAGINTVLKSLKFRPSEELLVTDQEYNACRNALEHIGRRDCAKVVVAPIPFPVSSPQEITDAILRQVTPSTRLALIDHVTSPTGLVLPVEDITAQLRERGVDVLIDGAHALGMLDLDLARIGATYYTGNCHKWMCAPKTSALLWVAPHRRERIRPLATSHGANARLEHRSRFHLEFDWTGTHDPTPALCVPASIAYFRQLLPGGWGGLRRQNRELVLKGRDLVCDALGMPLPAPDACIGSMATVPLPDGPFVPPTDTIHGQHPLQVQLWEQFKIEVPIVSWPQSPRRWVRLSAQLYNSIADYEKLAGALKVLV